MIFAIYIDDILLTKSDVVGIVKAKEYLNIQFMTMSRLRYFFRIELLTINLK